MKTAMQGTSLRAYFDDVLPEIDGKRREVLRVLIDDQTMDFTNMELADELRWSINRVTPRVFELHREGVDEADLVDDDVRDLGACPGVVRPVE